MKKTIQSFVRRSGRITSGQKQSLEQYLKDFGVVADNNLLDFDTIFGNDNPVILDIGFGNGEDLFHQAKLYPNYNFIGMEVYIAGIGSLLKRVHDDQLTNVRVMNGDAVEIISKNIANNSLARVQLLFPDPWPKKKHHKRRIVQISFLTAIYNALQKNGVLHIATDWQDYAEFIDTTFKDFRKFDKYNELDEKGIHFERNTTKFERKGIEKGHQIWDFSYLKSKK